MDAEDLDVVVYPTWNLPPLKIGDSFSDYYDGNNSPMIAPQTGGPAITVPMGQSSEFGEPGPLRTPPPWQGGLCEPGRVRGHIARTPAAMAGRRSRHPRFPWLPPLHPRCSTGTADGHHLPRSAV